MTPNKRKAPRLRRRRVKVKDVRLIVIATEGQETEPQYFGFLKSWCGTRKLHIEILGTEHGLSSPAHVLDRLVKEIDELREEYQLDEDDQFWLVIDQDTWKISHDTKDTAITNIAQKAIQKGFSLALSNPCFELWLYLHNGDVTPGTTYTKNELERMIRDHLTSYNSSRLVPEHYCGKINEAIVRAEGLHENKKERWPGFTGTHVYMLVEEIRKLAEEPHFPFSTSSRIGEVAEE